MAAQQCHFTLSLFSFKGKTPVPAGEEKGELGEYRQKLLMFLEISGYYDPARLICDFPFDGECLAHSEKPLQLTVMQNLIFPFSHFPSLPESWAWEKLQVSGQCSCSDPAKDSLPY